MNIYAKMLQSVYVNHVPKINLKKYVEKKKHKILFDYDFDQS